VDTLLALGLLLCLAPLIALLAVLVKLDSPGPVLYRCRRVGRDGRLFDMLKFRKMRADSAGLPLTHVGDARFTRTGRLLAALKVDEIPQLWNVVRGDMALVGPRPEDPQFVALYEDDFGYLLRIRPGITGLSQLAFARESELLTGPDPIGYYVSHLLPAKLWLDRLYCSRRSLRFDLRILVWTLLATCARLSVAVNRETGTLTIRRRPEGELGGSSSTVTAAAVSGDDS
jgi:lipopolysaccharide/colanic/teichoic acid biosynthesis glycosyltransferase